MVRSYKSPSSSGRGKEGILLRRRAAFPLTSNTPNRWNKCLMDSSSSLPVLLAWALASLRSWSTALLCQPPNNSTGRGIAFLDQFYEIELISVFDVCLPCQCLTLINRFQFCKKYKCTVYRVKYKCTVATSSV